LLLELEQALDTIARGGVGAQGFGDLQYGPRSEQALQQARVLSFELEQGARERSRAPRELRGGQVCAEHSCAR